VGPTEPGAASATSDARAWATRACAFAVVAALGACVADRPDLIAGDGSLVDDCAPFADLVVEYKPAGGDNQPAAAAQVLGGPDDAGVALVLDTVLTVGFVGLGSVVDLDGVDIGVAVIGTPAEGALASGYLSADGESYAYAGDLGPASTTLDLALAGLSAAAYVRVVGLAGELTIDAIEAVQSSCPAAARR
jgi:hypothetical protein